MIFQFLYRFSSAAWLGGTWFPSSKPNQMSCQSGRNVLRRSQHVYPMSSACTLSLSALRQLWDSQNSQKPILSILGAQNTYFGTHFENSSSPSKSEAGVRNWAIGSPQRPQPFLARWWKWLDTKYEVAATSLKVSTSAEPAFDFAPIL